MDCKDIEQAAQRLMGNIHNVKVTSSRTFSQMSGCDLYLKCENRQKTGSCLMYVRYLKIITR